MAVGLQPAYLIVGSDRPKVTRALARLRARFSDAAVERLSARDASGEDAAAACNAMGLFGAGERLVFVDEVERWKATDAHAVQAYLESPAPETVLALTGDVKADGPLGRAVRGRGEVLTYDVAKKKLPQWVAEQFERLGAHADPAACRALVEVVGEDVDALTAEVEKLATWAAGAPINEAEVEALAVGRADTAPFTLTDAWGRRDVAGALAACERLLERSQRPRRDELPRVAGVLASHVARVSLAQRLGAEGMTARDAAARIRAHPFVVEKAFRHASRYSETELADAVVALGELDFALKGGSRVPGDLELERALVAMTSESAGTDGRR